EEIYKTGTVLKLKNAGPSTIHIVSIWVNDATLHKRYDADIFINSGDTILYQRSDISLPEGNYVVKVVTEKGNIAIYSGG
ncbi:MAG: hypothetical protein ACP5JW_08245, partial [Candidatus Bathyarchaeia archaeon]